MRLFTGTSGFSYKEWCGVFYPDKMKPGDMLAFYGQKLSAVEINSSFYRMPGAETLAGWAEKVPPEFLFVLKASRRITHLSRLKDAGELVLHLWKTAAELGLHRGPFLFQLPPNFKADVSRLESFVGALPEGLRGAFEFRHPSWTAPAVEQLLKSRNLALCAADTDDSPATIVPTADWGYLRLRRDSYTDKELSDWVSKIAANNWREVFVFFKHEDAPDAPNLAVRFKTRFAEERPGAG